MLRPSNLGEQLFFQLDLTDVTRFEVIDGTRDVADGGGRALTKHNVEIGLSLQDDGKTLKVFLTKKKETV